MDFLTLQGPLECGNNLRLRRRWGLSTALVDQIVCRGETSSWSPSNELIHSRIGTQIKTAPRTKIFNLEAVFYWLQKRGSGKTKKGGNNFGSLTRIQFAGGVRFLIFI